MTDVSDRLLVSVITSFSPEAATRWSSGRWDVDGIVAGQGVSHRSVQPKEARENVWLWPSLVCRLHRDQAEAYYLNLMSDNPRMFVVCAVDADGSLRPILATASFDEAVAHDEGEQVIRDVRMPADVYRWLERFVLEHYVPKKTRKREREDWKKSDRHER